jgi:hypothetical protein
MTMVVMERFSRGITDMTMAGAATLSRPQSAPDQKYERHQRAGLRVETLLQIFISGIDLGAAGKSARRWRKGSPWPAQPNNCTKRMLST